MITGGDSKVMPTVMIFVKKWYHVWLTVHLMAHGKGMLQYCEWSCWGKWRCDFSLIPLTLQYGTAQPLHKSSCFLRRNPRHQAPRAPIPLRFTSLQSPPLLLLLLQGTHVVLTIVQFTQQLPPLFYLIP